MRQRVTDFVTLPEALRATHELVRMFRNRTVAHSQSDLTVTYALAVLDARTLEVRDVTAPIPMVRETPGADFDPSTTRPSYPTFHRVYLSPMVAD